MPETMPDALGGLSEALVERARRARPLVARILVRGQPMRSGTLWRKDVVVASEQSFPRTDEAEITLADGAAVSWSSRIAGRDPGTNVIALRLDGTHEPAPLPALEPQPGAFVLAFGADSSGLLTRWGIIHSVGPAWHSRAGGHIDSRIALDMTLTDREEGGPVLDAGGGLLGISTLGPRRRVLVIPSATVDRVLEPLLSKGRVERGWLGLALQPVLVPEELRAEAGQGYRLMVMRVAADSPAAKAGVLFGDILVRLDREGVSRPSTVAQHLGPESVGRSMELQLIRAGTVVALNATIVARPLD
jgi:S1-C subfamily serine protease